MAVLIVGTQREGLPKRSSILIPQIICVLPITVLPVVENIKIARKCYFFYAEKERRRMKSSYLFCRIKGGDSNDETYRY